MVQRASAPEGSCGEVRVADLRDEAAGPLVI
jgi:hypothetical protein